jgi:hypothetical protein
MSGTAYTNRIRRPLSTIAPLLTISNAAPSRPKRRGQHYHDARLRRLAARLRAIGTPLAIAALVVLLLLAALVTTPPPEPIPYDLDASHPAGLLALRLWLAELGYDVQPHGRSALRPAR